MNPNTPLRYNISDWSQLTECLSNNSRDFYITVSALIGHDISGKLIQVNHTSYGPLFAAMVSGHGTIISDDNTQGQYIPWLTTEEVLKQLEKFGYLVTFNILEHLPADQLRYLRVLDNLKYDHITTLFIEHSSIVNAQVVAFKAENKATWLQYGHVIHEKEVLEAFNDGSAISVSGMTKDLDFNWSWLTFVGNIKDILKENRSKE